MAASNAPVDTGFLRGSIHALPPGATSPWGVAEMGDRESGIAAGAIYALPNEERIGFMTAGLSAAEFVFANMLTGTLP